MDVFQPYQVPALIASILAVLGVFFKSVRVWSRHEKTIEGHSKMLEKCSEKHTLTPEECAKAQAECRSQQEKENLKILKAIEDLAQKFEARQEANHNELLKLTKSVGRIEGSVGRFRFSDDGVLS